MAAENLSNLTRRFFGIGFKGKASYGAKTKMQLERLKSRFQLKLKDWLVNLALDLELTLVFVVVIVVSSD